MSIDRVAGRRLAGGLLACVLAGGAAQAQAAGPELVHLWPENHWPQATQGPEKLGTEGSARGAVSNVGDARMEIYRPEHPNGTAVVIYGGGGYFRIQIGGAARPTAQWLQSIGVTAAVVYYRLPADGWSAVSPFQDGQRAMRLMRAKAAELGVDPHRIGVIGFSAGGNLAGVIGTRFDTDFYPAVDAADRQSARPDFLAMVYPVVSLRAPLDKTRSRRELGTQADAVEAYSVEAHVRKDMPPVFLAQAVDDPTVDVGHSVAMYQAAHAAGIPVELHLFEKGGHSWGLGKPGSLVAQWPRLFANWARSHDFLGAPPKRLAPLDSGGPEGMPAANEEAPAHSAESEGD
ncbi:MAG TPA: alpha/beta hydrolase [Xanthomonadaceae bacterium]|nr:alpha/beta hydrolase [Xanthomonadaceae bacterium]